MEEDQKLLDQVSTVPIYSQELQNYFRLHHLYEMPEFMLLVKLIRERGKAGEKGDHNVSLGTRQVRELRLKLQIIYKNLEVLQPPEFVFPKMGAR